jgi:hypothetical protein
MCAECLGGQFTDNNGAQSRSGSVAEDTKFDGTSSSDQKFEGTQSNSGNNSHIGQIGWGS